MHKIKKLEITVLFLLTSVVSITSVAVYSEWRSWERLKTERTQAQQIFDGQRAQLDSGSLFLSVLEFQQHTQFQKQFPTELDQKQFSQTLETLLSGSVVRSVRFAPVVSRSGSIFAPVEIEWEGDEKSLQTLTKALDAGGKTGQLPYMIVRSLSFDVTEFPQFLFHVRADILLRQAQVSK
jgi:hypothetical protein